jgi:hypothetical protein
MQAAGQHSRLGLWLKKSHLQGNSLYLEYIDGVKTTHHGNGVKQISEQLYDHGYVGSSVTAATAVTENEIDCTDEAEPGPEKIQLRFFLHIKNGKNDKNHKRNHFLNNLKLSQTEELIAGSIRWNLKAVFKEGNTPAHQYGDIQGFVVHRLKMPVPGKAHKDIRE